MPEYIPLATILVLSGFFGWRRGAKSQLFLTAVIVGGWLAITSPGSPLAVATGQKVDELAARSTLIASWQEHALFPALLLVAVILLACALLWRLGSQPESIKGALLGAILGLGNGLLIAWLLTPSLDLTPATIREATASLAPAKAQGSNTLPPVIIGVIFLIIILAVRAIRPYRPDFEEWFSKD